MNTDKTDKKETIIIAAIDEMADVGYHKASTPNIAKRAGVAKGSIFYYYPTKKDLLLACVEYAGSKMTEYLFENEDIIKITDVFDKIIAYARVKTEFLKENENMGIFLVEALGLSRAEGFEELGKLLSDKRMKEARRNLLANIDTSKFRDDADQAELIEFIYDSMEALTDKMEKQYGNAGHDVTEKELEESLQQLRRYVDFVKYGVYRR